MMMNIEVVVKKHFHKVIWKLLKLYVVCVRGPHDEVVIWWWYENPTTIMMNHHQVFNKLKDNNLSDAIKLFWESTTKANNDYIIEQ